MSSFRRREDMRLLRMNWMTVLRSRALCSVAMQRRCHMPASFLARRSWSVRSSISTTCNQKKEGEKQMSFLKGLFCSFLSLSQ